MIQYRSGKKYPPLFPPFGMMGVVTGVDESPICSQKSVFNDPSLPNSANQDEL